MLWAADRGHVDCVHALVAAGIDINVADQNGYTALHRAANGGFLDVVQALVAAKANLTLLDKVGATCPASHLPEKILNYCAAHLCPFVLRRTA